MATDRIELDPYVESFFDINFELSVANSARAYFHALSGGEMSITLIEHNVVYQTGGSSTLFIPGPTSFEPITLSQGVTSDMEFWKWWTKVTEGKKARYSATITAYGTRETKSGDKNVAQWELENTWPLKISGFSFDLDSTDPYIAEITLVAESITRVA